MLQVPSNRPGSKCWPTCTTERALCLALLPQPGHSPDSRAAVPHTWTHLCSHLLQEPRCSSGAWTAAPFQGLVQQLAGPQGCHGSAAIARAASAQPSPAQLSPSPVASAACSSISPGTPGAAAAGGAFLPPVPASPAQHPRPNTHPPLQSSHPSLLNWGLKARRGSSCELTALSKGVPLQTRSGCGGLWFSFPLCSEPSASAQHPGDAV